MKNPVVVYRSNSGYTKKYAQWIAQSLDCPLLDGKKAKCSALASYDTILYGGGLYAGKISGISLITKNIDKLSQKNLVIFAVGLGKPGSDEQLQSIANQNLPEEIRNRAALFQFQGGLDFNRLGFFHRLMLNMMRSILKKKQTLEEGDALFLAAMEHPADYTDPGAIVPLVDYVTKN